MNTAYEEYCPLLDMCKSQVVLGPNLLVVQYAQTFKLQEKLTG